MKRPVINLEPIECVSDVGKPYRVYVVNGAIKPPHTQGHIYCTGCGVGHHFRWNSDSRWIDIKCPICDTVSAWFEEYGGEEDEETA